MSENNINNFQTLIEQKRIVKEIIKKSMLAIGVPDRKAISDYRPAGIMWEDLLAQIRKELGSGGALTFEDLEDVPTYVGNALKGLRINATEDALDTYVPTDLNTWSIPGVAFVSPSTGNDFTAVVGDGEFTS